MFYHVRIFKPPKVEKLKVKAVATISNDLGDEYFHGDAIISAKLVSDIGGPTEVAKFKWSPGMQACPIELDLEIVAKQKRKTTAKTFQLLLTAQGTDLLHEAEDCGFLKVFSPSYIVLLKDGSARVSSQSTLATVVLRQVKNPAPLSEKSERISKNKQAAKLLFYEELGTHNLARHLWDAGICLSSIFSNDLITESYPQFKETFMSLNLSRIIELGSGCGIMGLCLEKWVSNSVPVYLTDTEDASELCRLNMDLNRSKSKYIEYTWGTAFPFEYIQNDSGPGSGKTLLVATDCTYNPGSYAELAATFDQFKSRGLLLLAHKYRSPDEEVFFEGLKKKYTMLADFTQDFYGQRVRIVLVEL